MIAASSLGLSVPTNGQTGDTSGLDQEDAGHSRKAPISVQEASYRAVSMRSLMKTKAATVEEVANLTHYVKQGLRRHAVVVNGADSFNPRFQALAWLQELGRVPGHAYTRGGAGKDHITR